MKASIIRPSENTVMLAVMVGDVFLKSAAFERTEKNLERLARAKDELDRKDTKDTKDQLED